MVTADLLEVTQVTQRRCKQRTIKGEEVFGHQAASQILTCHLERTAISSRLGIPPREIAQGAAACGVLTKGPPLVNLADR